MYNYSPSAKAKSEKRPWILRAKEASIQYKSIPEEEERQSLPGTLIYVSCGWHSFKEVEGFSSLKPFPSVCVCLCENMFHVSLKRYPY